ncbi:NAD(+) diphosphatase [Pontibacter silvestris]|uniref:NAD(+) diphosphatase n=1 Tax=Pontibacter silvestris TaxID=2305183 RepID=A0ABW4X5C4_9BACT|nr:NAD(+) diphosphatase [Pontibacter silvestris]MCC9134803.1 NAD(+) diphosphatase [Pontibacter silvestris]
MDNFFSGSTLDRLSEQRKNEELMQELWDRESSLFVVVSDAKSLLRQGNTEAVFLNHQQVKELAEIAKVRVLLGVEEGVAYFALGFEKQQEEIAPYLTDGAVLADLRTTAMLLPRPQSTLLAYARGIVHWNLRHSHCPECGNLTYSTEAGHVRACSNCCKRQFPRTDTAIIVLISEGDACLLGRQPQWPKGMYATVAGFLEPGEPLEEAVARETLEETGVELENIRYHSSQPWPFPASIMVGFTATARNRNIRVDSHELEDARWFTRDEIVDGLQNNSLILPPPVSIAYRLIRDWFNQDTNYNFAELLEGLAQR